MSAERMTMKIATVEAQPAGARPVPDEGRTMKALVFHGPGVRAWEERPRGKGLRTYIAGVLGVVDCLK